MPSVQQRGVCLTLFLSHHQPCCPESKGNHWFSENDRSTRLQLKHVITITVNSFN